MTNVYFISGMGASCQVFDNILLPANFCKKYLEWRDPNEAETLDQYAKSFASKVDTSQAFILVGYSFGGILVQEMNRYIRPEKTILLASIKDTQQMPTYFKIGKKIHFERSISPWMFNEKMIGWLLQKMVYKSKEPIDIKQLLPCVQYRYMQWAIEEILNWTPSITIPNLYQISGTNDKTFPYKRIKKSYGKNADVFYTVLNGGHLMVREQPALISTILTEILHA